MNVAIETAAKDASELQGNAQVGQVNKIKMAKGKQTVQFLFSTLFTCSVLIMTSPSESVSEFSPVQCKDLVFFLKCGLLLAQSELTLTNTVEISVAMETAAKDASDLQGSAQAGQVNKIKMTKSKQTVQFSSELVSEFSHVQCKDLVFFLKCGLLLAQHALTI
jgi:hypothetical protein